MKKPEINRVQVSFSQEGNTMGTTDNYENLEMSLEFQGDEADGCFYVIKSENGWSFDDLSEIKELVDRCDRMLSKNKKVKK